ncbi:MAG: F0F1 ATP synthase subunit delta [Rhodospirillaceae bacterium]
MSSDMAGQSGLADRYASALYELADEGGVLDAVATDLRTLKVMIDDSADLRRALSSPVIGREEQGKALAALAAKAEFAPLTTRFVGMVAANRRIFALPGMIKSFLTILAARRGEQSAEVISASPLTDAQRSALGAALKKAMGNDVSIEETVDPTLMGGMVVTVGSRMVDSSLRTKLKRLQLAMKGVG